jgi:hypothetical protein
MKLSELLKGLSSSGENKIEGSLTLMSLFVTIAATVVGSVVGAREAGLGGALLGGFFGFVAGRWMVPMLLIAIPIYILVWLIRLVQSAGN